MIDLQSCEWAKGRARKTDTKLYQKRLETQKKNAKVRGDVAKNRLTNGCPLFF